MQVNSNHPVAGLAANAIETEGPGATGGVLNSQKDSAEAQTAPKFGDLLQGIQAKYGAKAEKPREIKKTLGKDDFLRIMITQMKHQDPTNPFKAEQMAAEMAQFASVEQLSNLNQSMGKMIESHKPAERMAMAGLIGKSVVVDRDRFGHVEGQGDALSYSLPKDATTVKAVIISEQGEVVLEKDIGAQKAGDGSFAWDGLKSNTLPAKSGNYMLRIEAKDEHGSPIPTDPRARARVVGVSFEGGDPVLLVGDNKSQAKVPMRSVIRIEGDASPLPGAPSASGASAGGMSPPSGGPNFFTFQKGVGSVPLDSTSASPEAARALANYQSQSSGPATGSPARAGEESSAGAGPTQPLTEKGGENE